MFTAKDCIVCIFGFLCKNCNISVGLCKINVSVYTAELYAILLAVSELSKQQYRHYILFSDSLSSLNSIANKKPQHPITLQFLF